MTALPWQLRIAAKLAVSRLFGGQRHPHRAGLFRHGAMASPAYALKVFRGHLERARLAPADLAGKVALELGPGDSLFSALILRAHGAAGCVLVDADDYASDDPALYRAMAGLLESEGLTPPSLEGVTDRAGLLARCDARYLTEGLTSLQALPESSVDFVWSQAVLEHVRRGDFLDTMRALARAQKPGGLASHRVDLQDHLGGALNNLRFTEERWESDGFAGAGFYTNRIQCDAMLELFGQAGFAVELLGRRAWDRLPTPRARMAAPFRALPEKSLAVRGFDVLLRCPGADAGN